MAGDKSTLPKKPPGRPKGSVNKSTAEARRAIADFVDGNAHRLQGWLDQIANGTPAVGKDKKPILDADGVPKWVQPPNPQRAFELFQSVVEYHVPKLARQEITGADGNGLTVQIVKLSDADHSTSK